MLRSWEIRWSMISKNIGVAKGFQNSINIAYDLHNEEKVKAFIPTMASLDVIEDVLLSTAPTASQRARILIGAYGRGKSHIILVLMSLLCKKDFSLFPALLDKMEAVNPDLFQYTKSYIESDQKVLPIIVRGSSSSLTQSFLSALQQTLNEEGLNDIMPETHFQAAINAIYTWRESYHDTYMRFTEMLEKPVDQYVLSLREYDVVSYEKFIALYPELTSGSTFNPFLGFDVVELYENITEKLMDKGYSGTYIIYDEFSKYLESSIANATISDIKLLQDFAEKCNRSADKQMHLMLICHKDIANYIDAGLPKEKVDGWRGVSGRFKHIHLHNNFSQMYEIISAVIKKEPVFWDAFSCKNKKRFDDLAKRFTAGRLLDSSDENEVIRTIQGCYPLHPISTFILPRISERVAQNERTLFTFLSADDKYTLSAFVNDAEDDFPLLTPDYIYDYFEPLLRKEPYTSETHRIYKLTSSVLRKVEEDSLGAKIIKTISLIYIVEQYERLAPVYDVIVSAFRDQVEDVKVISDTLTELIEKDCIVYLKRSNNYLKLKESSGVDIPSEIISYIEKNRMVLDTKSILNNSAFDSYMYPTRYNDEFEITRYFDFKFIYGTEFFETQSWEMKIENTVADGVIYAVIPSNDEEIKRLDKALTVGQVAHERVVFVVPKKHILIEKIALEYEAVKNLKALVVEDELLSDEYDIYIEDLEEVLSSYIYSFTRPEVGGASYFYNGEKRQLYRKAQMSSLLSDICETVYALTPIINNESINKNVLPTVAINSRTKLLTGLLEDDLAPQLGLSGTGQDVSIMRSTLVQTGILINYEQAPTLILNPDNDNMRNMLDVIQAFFNEAGINGETNFGILYDRLTHPEHHIGLKRGVIPIYLAVVLHHIKKSVTILCRNREERITPDLLNGINESPESYSVIMDDWNGEKVEYITQLEELFRSTIIEREKTYNSYAYIIYAMSRWYMGLPKYAKELDVIYTGRNPEKKSKRIAQNRRKFLKSLKQTEINPREFLFEKLFAIFGMNEFNLGIIDNITAAKSEFDNALSRMTQTLICDVKKIFGNGNANETLTSSIKNWYESLSAQTVQHLFVNNENRVLELMQTITNDEINFIQRLSKAVTGLRMEDWNNTTIETFVQDLILIKEAVEEYDREEPTNGNDGTDVYRIIFTDAEGNEVTRSFSKSEYSDRAKLLLNDITTSLEEMGQSITEQEKRQVLMELLEKLC